MTSILLADPSYFAPFDEVSCLIGRAYKTRHRKWDFGNNWQETEALMTTAHDKLNLGNDHVTELGSGSFLS